MSDARLKSAAAASARGTAAAAVGRAQPSHSVKPKTDEPAKAKPAAAARPRPEGPGGLPFPGGLLDQGLKSLGSGRQMLAGAPEGHDARLLARLAEHHGQGAAIVIDDARAARLEAAIQLFAPQVEVLTLPAWDCLPYDRISPNPDTVARRIDALSRLLEPAARPRLVLLTVNAVLQRVMPRAALKQARLAVKPGARLKLEALQRFLGVNGYVRAETVREAGEYALRGGIVDIFPPGTEEPLRLDLFGDEVESIRSFDPASQRTVVKLDRAQLQPVAEFFMDEESIARFRAAWREMFGAVDDPLYAAVTAGRRYAGMEHWLPLFHDGMETVEDYLGDVPFAIDQQIEAAATERLRQVDEFYRARVDLVGVDRKIGAPAYRPLPPERLYLDAAGFEALLQDRPLLVLQPGEVPPGVPALDGQGRTGRNFADARMLERERLFEAVGAHMAALEGEGRRVLVAAYSTGARTRIASILEENGVNHLIEIDDPVDLAGLEPAERGVVVLPLEHGFVAPGVALITEADILGDRLARTGRRRKRRSDTITLEATGLAVGDLVVHTEHGVGRYDGLETIVAGGAPHDCVRVIYADNNKLFVPVENLEVLTRYGSEDSGVDLDRLGGVAWQSRKARVKRRLKDMAAGLLRIAAQRLTKAAPALIPPDGLYDEFSARFPYAETDDQARAIDNVVEDLGSGRPMDRLVCGDVGFGKTEVALRAAFVAAASGVQVAVVVPTTLLARQHYQTFVRRFAGMSYKVAQLSRLVTGADAKAAREGLKDGSVDIIVGTHALLSKDITFDRLGLVIVDEEQHFGVKQKERLKELAVDVHVLTLTATPIPRTLQLALTGVRELSVIATPPVDRLAVRTFVLPYDALVVREALLREHYRGGQSFYVVPRIEDLAKVEAQLKQVVPDLKVVVAHGQMAPTELEEKISLFYDGAFDILLATNIVESGLDIPRANTLIVHRADLFGLAQLYQIRGRIGRSKLRGYAYLTTQPNMVLSEASQSRLHVISTLDSLGAGLQLASHDLDLRGAGNLLGEEQSGHIKEVGVELYQQMLRDAVDEARRGSAAGMLPDGTAEPERWIPQINLGMPVLIPDDYVADLSVRLSLYRRLAELEDASDVDGFAAELVDRFGSLPDEVKNLLEVITFKQLCRKAGVERVDAGPKGALVTFRENKFTHVDRLATYLQKNQGLVKLRPDQKLIYPRSWDDQGLRLRGTRRILSDLVKLAS